MDQEDIDRKDLVPAASFVVILLAGFIAGFDYYFIQTGATLLLYAVIVQIYTSPAVNDARDSHVMFLFMSLSAVMFGYVIEQIINEATGDMLAIQAIAIAVLLSRFYVNWNAGEMFRWEDPIDRYVIYIPCAVAILLPVLLNYVVINPILGFDPNSLVRPSSDSFITLIYLSIIAGVVAYGRIEEDWSLGD